MPHKQGKKLPKRVGNQHRQNKRAASYQRFLRRMENGGKRIHMRRSTKEAKPNNVLEFPVPRVPKGKINPGNVTAVRILKNKQGNPFAVRVVCLNCKFYRKFPIGAEYSIDLAYDLAFYAAHDHVCTPSEFYRPGLDENREPVKIRK